MNEHNNVSYYLQALKPIRLINLMTNEGANQFMEMLEKLPDPTLIDAFNDKLSNIVEVKNRKAAPSFKSVGQLDKKLAEGIATYKDKLNVDGWVLKLPAQSDEEYMFVFPSEHFRISKFVPRID
jgi:hypothetical protein